MNETYMNPFIESFSGIMPQFGYSSVEKGKFSIKEQELVFSGVNIIVGIVGEVKGNVVYCIDEQSAKGIASIMMGMEIDDLDDMSMSALSELANMLTASAATAFYNMGITIDISTPTLLQGKNVAIKMSSKQVLSVELIADTTTIEVNVAFE